MTLKVGDTIYKFDENHRVYRREAQGGPIFAEHFVPFVIAGETKHSWLSGYGGDVRVNKKTMQSAGQGGYHGHQWYDAQGKDDCIWKTKHRIHIERALASATTDQLKQIAIVLGYVAL